MNKAFVVLTDKYGDNPKAWKMPAIALTYRSSNFFGVPQAGKNESFHQDEYHNRGTENDLIIFKENGAEAWDVVAPGQSGFISQAEIPSKHYDDQLTMYSEFGKKTFIADQSRIET